MKKIINPGRVMIGKMRRPVFCIIKINDGKLSITGVEGPKDNGNCFGSCGQIAMHYAHRDSKDNDKRIHCPMMLETFEAGWSQKLWFDFLTIWKRWHLNDMQSACEHQRKLGWTYKDHHDKETFQGEACPECGYKIGSAWLKEELPSEVIQFLEALPPTQVTPAWC